MATNPAVSMPNADRVREATRNCPFVVVSDVIATGDTVALADVRLPATAWGEKTGTVTNSERRISRQRSFLKPPGECRHDWDILSDVARRMGFAGFDYSHPSQIFGEHAALSAFENDGGRDFNIGAWTDTTVEAYDGMRPFQWPAPGGDDSVAPMFADGRFYTPDGLARFVPTPVRSPANNVTDTYPVRLVTMRVRDHWHTMTRTGKTPRLSQHYAEPFIEIHPSDALRAGVAAASIVRIVSPWGEALARALITHRVRSGDVAVPMHWTGRLSSRGRIDAVVNPDNDPVSGQPELKHTPVRLEPWPARSYAVMISREEVSRSALDLCGYWAQARIPGGWIVEAASEAHPGDLLDALSLAGQPDVLEMRARDDVRRLVMSAGGAKSLVIAGPAPVAADRTWLRTLLNAPFDPALRAMALAGRPPAGAAAGPLVCSCRGVGAGEIEAAVRAGALSVTAVGKACGAGVTCGSCKPEVTRIIERCTTPQRLEAAE
jgi:assimilatory nitrate reductase catalytic subunit